MDLVLYLLVLCVGVVDFCFYVFGCGDFGSVWFGIGLGMGLWC